MDQFAAGAAARQQTRPYFHGTSFINLISDYTRGLPWPRVAFYDAHQDQVNVCSFFGMTKATIEVPGCGACNV